MTNIDDVCPDAKVLSAYIDGTLTVERVPRITHHVTRCSECRRAVENVIEIEEGREDATPQRFFGPGKWVALAAGLVLVAVAVPTLRSDRKAAAAAMTELTAATPASFRFIEPRLSGGFPWAPFRGVRRDDAVPKSTEELIATGAAGKVVRELSGDRRPESLHVTGVAYLIAGDAAAAVKFLSDAAAREEDDPSIWSDLAAALYIAAAGDDVAEFRRALEAADRAIRLDPTLAEAHFNRAVILEQIGTPREAADAWRTYVSAFPQGPWSTEARERLGRVSRE